MEARPARWRLPVRISAWQLTIAAVALGVALRLGVYLHRPSLYIDEAAVSSSLIHHSLRALLTRPLDYDQIAPPGFLVMSKLVVMVFGSSEYALRLIPLLASIGALLLFPRLARKVLEPAWVPVATLLLAVSCPVLYWGLAVKPYGEDVLLTIVVLLMADRYACRPLDRMRLVQLALIGVVALLFSLPAMFVIAGIGGVLFIRAVLRRSRRQAVSVVAMGVVWAIVALPVLRLAQLQELHPEYMHAWWSGGFIPWPLRSPSDWAWFPATVIRFLWDPLGSYPRSPWLLGMPAALALTAGVAGVWRMAKQRDLLWAMFGGCTLSLLIALAAGRYPVSTPIVGTGRVLLFLLPAVLLILVAGLQTLRTTFPALGYTAAVSLVLSAATLHFVLPPHPQPEETRPLLAYFQAHRHPGDILYVYYGGGPATEYYTPRLGLSSTDVVIGRCGRTAPDVYLRDVDRLRHFPRVWVLLTHRYAPFGVSETRYTLSYLDATGRRLAETHAPGAALYLYALDPAGAPPRGAAMQYDIPPIPFAIRHAFDCVGVMGPVVHFGHHASYPRGQ